MAIFKLPFTVFFDYLSLQTFLLFGLVFLAVYRLFNKEAMINLPPGPSTLPLIGNAHELGGKQMHVVTAKLAEKFGSMMTLNIVGMKVVLLSDLKAIKEAFLEKGDCFADRFQHELTEYVNGVKGSLVFENGEGWKVHRRMTLTALRNFGMGKRSLENKINEEGRCLASSFAELDGMPFDPQHIVQNAVANIICSISFGNRYDYDDPEFRELLNYIKVFFEQLNGPTIVGSFPKLWFTPLYRSIRKQNDNFNAFLRRVVDQHIESFDSNDIRDIIDSHLLSNKDPKEDKTKLPSNRIWRGIFDLFAAGTDTTSNTILWALLIFTQYPHVQEKVQNEIDEIIGRERPPTLLDRLHMPYLDAALLEIQRFRPVACFLPPRANSVDTELLGYTLPKGTQIWANLYAVLHSPEHWQQPEEFIPERFLSPDGKQTVKPEAFMPFGAGRRVCIGEQLARMELFLLVINLLQRFTFKISEKDPKPSLAGELGITLAPDCFRIRAYKR